MTLDEFLENEVDRAWVEEGGIARLYVRKGARALRDQQGKLHYFSNVFDIASVQSENERQGAFSRLVRKLEEKWDGPIYVESVQEAKFIPILIHLGFSPVNPDDDFMGIPRNFAKHMDKGKKKDASFSLRYN